ncbi:hypothetical protein E6P09_07605 [Haloferax mediterranei ATCC 33500]|uniref:Uncharacterized protein n=1 Tax=Haloferax mediterranei (strain ATCC 33500 / DSM 1411 / JCM 8866 / NBRC 14739 / NCIMB 2177 / R-4) TaxID=523841 RepID=I3R323_HALMT|nr:hypothetical protein [Haloferax mediterranei]AFK18633.1 hypothetical protein HFX_0912 [Haloferax mediterranei ATCC 33500]AHZ21995.1 hypothetical protein BM92_04655 [Haloferax mediterranei ATCC 33500]EMA02091.1 hypothetical protein C439_05910 [Haloferax mediterranei ATCC 33500]MDX5988726.1 hypothetical protein [Haloferax mediterranei ATCC 33500]QCQ75133.1 hypothetical protein E6P09_07605 [Haloferax mediterranei ATCC 33500]
MARSEAKQYVADDGSIKVGKLIGTLLAAGVTLWGSVQIELMSTLVNWQVSLIDFVGRFLSMYISNALGESAGLVTDSWRAAAVQAVQFGPFAPVLMALEGIVVLLIVHVIWSRRDAIW